MNKISLEIALDFVDKLQEDYPKIDVHKLTVELAERIDDAIKKACILERNKIISGLTYGKHSRSHK